MIERRKWFKGSRDRGLIALRLICINTYNEEFLKKNNSLKLKTAHEDLKAS